MDLSMNRNLIQLLVSSSDAFHEFGSRSYCHKLQYQVVYISLAVKFECACQVVERFFIAFSLKIELRTRFVVFHSFPRLPDSDESLHSGLLRPVPTFSDWSAARLWNSVQMNGILYRLPE